MVDLVKIRRKAKQKKEQEREREQASAPEVEQAVSSQREAPETPGQVEPAEDRLALYKKGLGRARVAAPRPVEESGADDDTFEVLLFTLAGEQFAIPIERISEIIELREPTRVPNSDPMVSGIISLRGTIVTIVDAEKRLGHGSAEDVTHGAARGAARRGPDARIVVTERQGELTGFVVDRVSRVLEIHERQLEAPPLLDESEQRAAFRGLFRLDGVLTMLLDLEELLA